jgi:hypothetical protein
MPPGITAYSMKPAPTAPAAVMNARRLSRRLVLVLVLVRRSSIDPTSRLLVTPCAPNARPPLAVSYARHAQFGASTVSLQARDGGIRGGRRRVRSIHPSMESSDETLPPIRPRRAPSLR